MRKLLILSFLSAGLLIPSLAQDVEPFNPSGKIFGLLYTDYHLRFSDGKSVSAFQVTRSYLGYDYSFSKTISSRVLFDGFTQTINGHSVVTGYLRNAYLQYNDEKLTVRGGLIGSEELSIADKFWNYRYITKSPVDYNTMILPVDLGISARYKAADFISVDVALLNGRGYKDITPDTTLKVVTGATFTPIDKLLLRAYYDMMGPSGNRQSTVNLTAAYIDAKFTLGAEYFIQTNHNLESGSDYSGFNIFSAFRFNEKFSLFARYDNLSSVIIEGETDPWNIDKDGGNFFVGLDYNPVKNVRISPNFIGFIPADADASFTGSVGISVEARF